MPLRKCHFTQIIGWVFVLFCLAFSLTGCGFKLQGENKLSPPLHRLYLQSTDPYGQLARSLRDNLKLSHVQLVNSPEEATTILNIISDTTAQTLLSVNSTQQTRQYNISVTVVFEINDAKGGNLLPAQSLSEGRSITVQSNDILSSSNEADLLYRQMRRSIASSLMTRIASKEVTNIIYNALHATHAPVKP